MQDSKPRKESSMRERVVTLWSDQSPEARSLETALRGAGYEVSCGFTASPWPTAEYRGDFVSGYQAIQTEFDVRCDWGNQASKKAV